MIIIGEYAMNNQINRPVSVTAVRFDRRMNALPTRMEWDGQTYTFVDTGICVTSRSGNATASTITLSDGLRNFCLRQTRGIWTLLKVC